MMQQFVRGLRAAQEIRVPPGDIAESKDVSKAHFDVLVRVAACGPRRHAGKSLQVGKFLIVIHRAPIARFEPTRFTIDDKLCAAAANSNFS